MAAAGSPATEDDYRFLAGQAPAAPPGPGGAGGGQEQPPRRKGGAPPVLPHVPGTAAAPPPPVGAPDAAAGLAQAPAESLATESDYDFLAGKATPAAPPTPNAQRPTPNAQRLTPRQMKAQLDSEGRWISNENENVKAYQQAIAGKPIAPEQWSDYQQRVAELQRRSQGWQSLNAQYQGLPAATVPPIRPVQYHVPPEEARLAAIEPALAKRGHAPSSLPVIAGLKQQYGIGQAALAGTFAARKAQLDADGQRLQAQDKALAAIGQQLSKGELSPATEGPFLAALRQHQINVGAYNGTAETLTNQVNRYNAFLKQYQNEDLHLGMVYPEEVGTGPGPSASQRVDDFVRSYLTTPISARAEKNVPIARRALMLAGRYPDLPELPRNLPADQKAALIRQKNDLLALLTYQGPVGAFGQQAASEYPIHPQIGKAVPAPDLRHLTPFQQQLLPILQQQLKAEAEARRLAGLEKAGYVDAATLAAGILLGNLVGGKVTAALSARFAPLLLPELAAGLELTGPKAAARLFAARTIPAIIGQAAGFGTASGVAGGITGAAYGPPKFDKKTGKPIPPTPAERAQYGLETGARAGLTGAAIGAGVGLAGELLVTGLAALGWRPLPPGAGPAGGRGRGKPPAGPLFYDPDSGAVVRRIGLPRGGWDVEVVEPGTYAASESPGRRYRIPQVMTGDLRPVPEGGEVPPPRSPGAPPPSPEPGQPLTEDQKITADRLLKQAGPPIVGPEGSPQAGGPPTAVMEPPAVAAPGQEPPAGAPPAEPPPPFDSTPVSPRVPPGPHDLAALEQELAAREIQLRQAQGAGDRLAESQLRAQVATLTNQIDDLRGILSGQLIFTPGGGGRGPVQTAVGAPGEPGVPFVTPAGVTIDLRTRPLPDLIGFRDQLASLHAQGQLSPLQQAEYGRLQRYLDGSRDRELSETAPPVSEEAKAAITNELTAPARRRVNGLDALDQGIRAAEGRGDHETAAALSEARTTLQRTLAQTINRHFAGPDTPLPPAVPPLRAAPLRSLTPEQFGRLPGAARLTLLLQDLTNSSHVFDPTALPFVERPRGLRNERQLQAIADEQYGLAGRFLGNLFAPAVEEAPSAPASPTAAAPPGLPGETPPAPGVTTGPSGPSSPTGTTPSLPAGSGGPVSSPTPTTLPPAPPSGPIIPSAPGTSAGTSVPVTPENLRPGAKVRSIGTGIGYEIEGPGTETGRWAGRVTVKPEASRVPVSVGDVRQLPESALLDPTRYDYHGNDRPLPGAPPATGTEPSAPVGEETTPAAETTPSVSPSSGPTRPTSSPPSEPRPGTTATPRPSTGTTAPPTPSATPPSALETSPPSTTETTPSPVTGKAPELPRILLYLIDQFLERINARMTADEPIFKNNPELEAFAGPILLGSRAAGTFTAQTVYNALEAAVNRYVVQQQFGQQEAKAALDHVTDLQKALPTQTIRAGDKDALQQFSTPPTLALVAAYALQAKPGENLLEPSAGTGSLLAMAESLYGHSPRDWLANEIDPERRAIVDEYFAGETFAVDGRYLNAMLPHGLSFDLILMNPPFSAAETQRARNTNEIGFDHVEQALKRLKPGGRLVAILGRGAALDRPTAAGFWQGVRGEYTLRANIGLPGAEYQKYGTSFATRLVIIDNAGPTEASAVIWTEAVTSPAAAIEGLYERGILERATGEGRAPSVGAGPAGATGERGGEAGATPPGRRGERGSGEPGGRPGVAVPPEPGAPGETVPGPVAGTAPGAGGERREPGSGPAPAGAVPGARPGAGGTGNQPDRQLAAGHVPGLRQYHGTSAGVTLGRAYDQVQYQNLYGPGFYTTDNPEVAKTYTKKGKGKAPTVYEVRWIGDHAPRFLDLNQPLPEAVRPLFEAHNSFAVPLDFTQPGRRIYDDLKSGWEQDMLPAAEVQEEMHALADALVEAGYDGMTHTGGVGRKLGPHHVVIYFHPVDEETGKPNLELVPLGEAVKQPVAPPKPKAAKAEPVRQTGRQDVGTQYVTYQAPYVLEGRPHPAVMVETRSLAAVDPPAITVTHSLKEEALYPTAALAKDYAARTGRPAPDPNSLGISQLQLEAALYAKQRAATTLPSGERAGSFLGDGTGAGKGRSQAAIAGDAWENGGRRIYWLSAQANLINNARDDLAAIGYGHIPVKKLNDFPGGEPIPADFEGIIFSTYATLIQPAKSGSLKDQRRRYQMERWLAGGTAENHQGDRGEQALIMFDESHMMKNAISIGQGRPSDSAIEGMALQQNLPRARVVYASATGMTDIENMAYLTRLGMWGPGTPWAGGFGDFAQEMKDRAKMEMIARDMKARGAYLAREQSYQDPQNRPEQSVEIRELRHTLTGEDERNYNLVADAWQIVLQNIHAALEITGNSSQARKNAMTAFWGQHQQFFRRFLTALKLPTLYADIDQQLAEGRSVIVSLIGTGDAATKRAVTAAILNDGDLDDLDLTPIQALVRLVERSFPTRLYVEEIGPDGVTTILVPAEDADGNPVHDPDAIALKERLLERLSAITERLPGNPLDEILFRYGHQNVAELTSREQRLEPADEGGLRYATRGGSKASVAEMERFNRGEKRIAVISGSASVGISLHAGLQFGNQQRRVQYMLELSWSADKQMQFNGRGHRTNQASAPIFVPVSTNAGGEVRFAASIARRLASMGALTRGSAGATGAGGALDQYDYENEYGRAALARLYEHIRRDGPIPGLAHPMQALRDMGLIHMSKAGFEDVRDEDREHIPHFFNRLLALHIDRQNPLFEAFDARFQHLIEIAKENGEFDFGVQDIRGENIREAAPPQVVYTDPVTGAEATYHHVVADVPTAPVTLEQLDLIREADRQGFFQRNSDQKLVYVARTEHPVNPNRVMTPSNAQSALVSSADLATNFSRIPAGEQIGARRLWEQEVAAVPPFAPRHYHILAGSLMGVWDRIRSAGQERLDVRRALLPDGTRVVGVALARSRYKKVLQQLGASAEGLNPADLYASVLDAGEEVELTSGVSLSRGRVGGQPVVRINGLDDAMRRDLYLQGFPQERIGSTYRYQVWVPADPEQGPALLAQLLQRFPPVETGTAVPAPAPPAVPSPRRRGLAVLPPTQVPLFGVPEGGVPFPTLRWLERSASGLSVQFQRLAAGGLEPEAAERAHDFGVLLWPELVTPEGPAFLGGLSAPVYGPGGEEAGRAVYVNPFPPLYGAGGVYQGMKESPDPAYVAGQIADSMIHELAHQVVEEEGGPLLEAISAIKLRLGPERLKEARDGIERLIADGSGKLTAGYLAGRRGYSARARADRRPPPALGAEGAADRGRALGQVIGGGGPPEPLPDRGDGSQLARRSGEGHRTEPAQFPDPGLEAQIEEAALPPPPAYEWLRRAFTTLPGLFVRDWPFLPQRDPAYAELRYRFTHLDKAWGRATMNGVLNLAQIYGELNKNDQTLYRRCLIALDMEEEVGEQLRRLLDRLGDGTPLETMLPLIALPQGDGSVEQRWTPAKAARMADWARAELGKPENQAVAEALDIRKLVFNAVLDRLSAAQAAVSGKPLTFSRREWFHHLINDFAESERHRRFGAGARGAGGGRVKARTLPFTLRREGSLLNYQTEDIAVELSWLPGALYNTYVYEFMAWVRDRYDIKKELQKAALAINLENLMEQLEAAAAEINRKRTRGEPVTAEDLYRRRFNAPIAEGFWRLGWLCRHHPDWLPGSDDERWEDLIDQMAVNFDLREDAAALDSAEPEIDPEAQKQFFAWLQWLLTPPQAGQAGSGAAAQIFKGLRERRQKIKNALGLEYVTWRDLLHKKFGDIDFTGYEAWQPAEGSAFYGAWAVRDRVAQAVLEAENSGTGLALNLTPEDLRRVKVLGGRKPEWVVPRAVAEQLDNFKNPYTAPHPALAAVGKLSGYWKQWTLLNPLHYVGYHFRNELTDLEMLSFNPDAARYLPFVAAALRDFLIRKQLPVPDLQEWLDWGGQVSTLQASEAGPTGATLDMLAHLKEGHENLLLRLWKAGRIAGDMREAILRFAMYLSYRDQMLADPEGRPPNYGASDRRSIDAIQDLRLRAWVLSNDLMGPYDRVPQGYKLVRTVIPAPFLNWKIINTRRQLQLINNEIFERVADWIVMRMPLEGGGAGGGKPPALPPTGGGGPGSPDEDEERRRRLREWMSLRAEAKKRGLNWRWVVGRLGWASPMLLYWIFRYLVKANLLNALEAGHNWALHRDEEEHLPPWVRYRPHIDLGHVPGTKLYAYIDRTSGVGDAAGFFGVDNLPGYWQQVRAGRMSVAEAMRNLLVQGPGQELYNQVGLPKTVMEFLLRRKGFPDLDQPREINDRWQYVFDQLSLGKVYQTLRPGIPHHLGKLAPVVQMLGVSFYHPGETAYGEMRETAENWAKAKGFWEGPPGGTDRSEMAYWVKRAMKVGDTAAVRHFLVLYWQLGKNDGKDDENFATSLKDTYPLHGWTDKQRTEFLQSLDQGEQQRWRDMLWFMQQTYVPELKTSPAEMQRYGHAPIETFDAWLWERVEAGIDSQSRFAGFEKTEPKAYKARREREKMLGP